MGRQIIVEILGDSSKLDRSLTSATSGTQKFGNVLQGIGQGIGQKAFGLIESAVGSVTGAIGEAVRKAEEYEVASTKLNTALTANVKGWTGNRDAIDAYVASQSNLGFNSVEVTNSLAQLVAATGDVGKAQTFLATAEDLARLKGVSLAEATDGLTKVEAGSYRILKSLGIELPKNATQTEALAAVQRIAAGQAKAYGDTTAGAMDKMNAKVEEAQIKIGKGLTPVLNAATIAVGDLFDAIDGGTRDTVQGLEKETYNMQLLGGSLNDIAALTARARDEKEQLLKSPFTTQSEMDSINRTIDALDGLSRSTQSVGKAVDDYIPKAVATITASFGPGGAVPADFAWSAKAAGLIGHQIAGNLLSGQDDVRAAAMALSTAETTPFYNRSEINAWLHGKGSLGKQLVKDLTSHNPIVREAAKKLKKVLQDELDRFALQLKLNIEASGQALPTHASGGFAAYGQAAVFGEHGAEVGVPAPGGLNILTAAKSKALFGGGGGGTVINNYISINGGLVDGPTIDRLVTALTQRMRFASGI